VQMELVDLPAHPHPSERQRRLVTGRHDEMELRGQMV
jgi:hypothetical protein